MSADRWDLQSLSLRNYDTWLTDVGPQPNQPDPRCFCCGVRLSIQRAVRHLVCDTPDCEAWLKEAKEAFTTPAKEDAA